MSFCHSHWPNDLLAACYKRDEPGICMLAILEATLERKNGLSEHYLQASAKNAILERFDDEEGW